MLSKNFSHEEIYDKINFSHDNNMKNYIPNLYATVNR